MEKRNLGGTGFQVAPLAFGGNVFGWTIDENTSFGILDAFVEAGFNLVDTADVYAHWKPGNKGGESETIIGKWLKKSGRRQDVVIATKVGGSMGPGDINVTKKYILKAAEDSLRRLQIDCIDLYQLHWDDEKVPVGETLEAFAQLVQQGKVKAIGASNMSAARLQQSLAWSKQNGLPQYQTLQPEYNLYNRQPYEQAYEPLCMAEGLGVINYFALASGFLSGKYRTAADAGKSTRGDGVVKTYLNERGLRILAALDEVAARFDTNPASVAIAWLIKRASITAPIASATTVQQLQALIKAVNLPLDDAAIQILNKASAYA